MLQFNFSTFVLQRRINRPYSQLANTIANPEIFGADCVIASGPAGSLRLDSSFRRVETIPASVFRATATMFGPSGQRIAPVEIELSAWSVTSDTELIVRPSAAHPERWMRSRTRRYFEAAHRSADGLTALLLHSVPTASPVVTART
jgi:hypothetical protein